MKALAVAKYEGAGKRTGVSRFACVFAAVSASTASLILSMAMKVSWTQDVLAMLIAAALVFGFTFTILEMRSLANQKH
jgi:hypothetical protein